MLEGQLDFGGELCPECEGSHRIFNRAGTEIPCPRCGRLSDPDRDDIGKFQRPGDAAETQREAALSIYPRSGTARRRVLDYIAATDGATDEQMQEALRMNPSTQRPRRVELVEGGWIRDSERRRRTRSNHAAVIWVLTERGRAAYAGKLP